jgi:hypothetical protein
MACKEMQVTQSEAETTFFICSFILEWKLYLNDQLPLHSRLFFLGRFVYLPNKHRKFVYRS